MVFSSTVFMFLFLPVVLTGYLLMFGRLRNVWLLAASLFFYAWGEKFFVIIMLASILINYAMGLWIDRTRGSRWQHLGLFIAVVANLGLLGYYKYANLVFDTARPFLASIGFHNYELQPIHLPIGISFFTFQAMSYVIDVYRNEAPVQRNPLNIALYISLFPQLIAGPIVRYHDIARQIVQRRTTFDSFAYGVQRFIIGLGKKVIIANTVALPADTIFALPAGDLTTSVAWLGIACYTLQIYFDFSGYSDMAIGLGHMFGFHFLENFNFPYISRNIREFWRRWHISLSSWFRDYLYIPLGGNRGTGARTYANLVLVFFLCGLWHGASWTFAIWGLYHGLFLVVERLGLEKLLQKAPRPFQHSYTLMVVMVGWVFFRSETFAYALSYLAALVGLGQGTGIESSLDLYMNNELLIALIAGAIGSAPLVPWLASRYKSRIETGGFSGAAIQGLGALSGTVVLAAILLVSCVLLASQTHNPFIYFRF